MKINPIRFQNGFQNFKINEKGNQKETQVFSDLFRDKLSEVNELQQESQKITAEFAAGENNNIHDVMIAAEKAKVAVNLTTAVQTKILDAYNEVMRLQL